MKLSIVIATLNRLPYLQKCIASARRRALSVLADAPIKAEAKVGLSELAGLAANRSA